MQTLASRLYEQNLLVEDALARSQTARQRGWEASARFRNACKQADRARKMSAHAAVISNAIAKRWAALRAKRLAADPPLRLGRRLLDLAGFP
jgi:hypothetical protein